MHMAAQPLDHGLEHMVGQQPQPAGSHLQRDMPIADVIRNACEGRRIVRMHLEQVFGRGLHRHHPAIVQKQSIAVTHEGARGQIDTDLFATQQGSAKAGALTLLERQFNHGIGRTLAPGQGMGHH